MTWIPTISSSAIVALIILLVQKLLFTRLENSVRHEFESKLEEVRANLRQKKSQIDALRNGALTGVTNRQFARYQRKLNSVEKVWECVIGLAPTKMLSNLITEFDYGKFAAEAKENEHIREMMNILCEGIDRNIFNAGDVDAARLYVSPLSWAYFSAYRSIASNAYIRHVQVSKGIEIDFTKQEALIKKVLTALPHHRELIEKNGYQAVHLFLDELEDLILKSLQNDIEGADIDKESIEFAAEILKAADEAAISNKRTEINA